MDLVVSAMAVLVWNAFKPSFFISWVGLSYTYTRTAKTNNKKSNSGINNGENRGNSRREATSCYKEWSTTEAETGSTNRSLTSSKTKVPSFKFIAKNGDSVESTPMRRGSPRCLSITHQARAEAGDMEVSEDPTFSRCETHPDKEDSSIGYRKYTNMNVRKQVVSAREIASLE